MDGKGVVVRLGRGLLLSPAKGERDEPGRRPLLGQTKHTHIGPGSNPPAPPHLASPSILTLKTGLSFDHVTLGPLHPPFIVLVLHRGTFFYLRLELTQVLMRLVLAHIEICEAEGIQL